MPVTVKEKLRLDKYLLSDISDYDFKIYSWIKYDYFKLYFITDNILKNQFVKIGDNIKETILNNDFNNIDINDYDDDLDEINMYCRQIIA